MAAAIRSADYPCDHVLQMQSAGDNSYWKLSNRGFLENAPTEVVEEVREKVGLLSGKLEKLNENLRFFEGLSE